MLCPFEKPLGNTLQWNTLGQNRHFVNPKPSSSHKFPKAHPTLLNLLDLISLLIK